MTPDRWERIKALLSDALERPAAERERFVHEAAKDDPELLADLLKLIREDDPDAEFGSQPALTRVTSLDADETPRFLADAVLARRFRIVRFIARGGMGEVYEAEDLELGGRVALKAIRREVAPEPEMLALFKREIQLARQVTHPNVCRIYDLAQSVDAQTGDVTMLLSMELLEGQTLSELLQKQGPIAFRSALPLIEEIAAGLQAVHDAGIIHGDLKPGNVMLASRPGEPRPRAVVMDFGLACRVAQGSSDSVLIRGGTPEYSAPEQAAGAPLSSATDVYCLALMIADMLGVPRCMRLRPDATRMPLQWARLLRRCMDAKPARRCARPADVAHALRVSADSRKRMAVFSVALMLAAGTGIWGGIYVLAHRNATKETVNRLVWTLEGRGAYPDGPSADGRYLVVIDTDRRVLALHDLATGQDRPVTKLPAAPGSITTPVLSADGKRIVFAWQAPGSFELRMINTDGSGMRTLCNSAAYPSSWSSDGKQVLATLYEPDASSIAMISLPDCGVRILKRDSSRSSWAGALSPNRKYALYLRRGGKEIRSYVISTDGSTESALVPEPSSAATPVWSPDGARVLFISNRSGSPGLWSVRISDGKPIGEPEQLRTDFRRVDLIGSARDGSLYYILHTPQSDIYLANLDPFSGRLISQPKRVNQRSVGNANGRIAWLPDGNSLSYWNRSNERDTLVIHTLATGEERELWDHADGGDVSPGYAGWFADGRSLMSWERKARTMIFRRLESRTLRILATWTVPDIPAGAARSGLVFSPDLMTWFFARRDETKPCNRESNCVHAIMARSLESGKDRELFQTNDVPLRFVASPDGHDLAVTTLHSGSEEYSLLIARAAGGMPREIHRGKDPLDGALAWTANGKHVLVFRNEAGHGVLWSFPVSGGRPESSVTTVGVNGYSAAAISPNGSQIAFVAGDYERRELWVATGLFDKNPGTGKR